MYIEILFKNKNTHVINIFEGKQKYKQFQCSPYLTCYRVGVDFYVST